MLLFTAFAFSGANSQKLWMLGDYVCNLQKELGGDATFAAIKAIRHLQCGERCCGGSSALLR